MHKEILKGTERRQFENASIFLFLIKLSINMVWIFT